MNPETKDDKDNEFCMLLHASNLLYDCSSGPKSIVKNYFQWKQRYYSNEI